MDVNKLLENVWVEKYRPRTVDDLICDEKTRKLVAQFKKKGEIPNLLLAGPAGCGKTSCAKIIVGDVLDCQYLYINASDENGIDTVRSKITSFAQVKSIDGKVKVIILDEADGITGNGLSALRGTMEAFAEYTRFILTCNYKHKIITPIQSRCQVIQPKLEFEHVTKRCLQILKNEGVKIVADQKKPLVELIKQFFPDVRKIINELQKNVIDGVLQINSITVDKEFFEEIINKLTNKNSLGCRKLMIENENLYQGDHLSLLRQLLNFVYDSTIAESKKKAVIATIAEFMYRSVYVVDQEINTFHCLIQLEGIL